MRLVKWKSIPLWVVSTEDTEVWSGNERKDAYTYARELLKSGEPEVTVEHRQWTILTLEDEI